MRSIYYPFKYIIECCITIFFIPIITFYAYIYKSKKNSLKRIVWGPNKINHTKSNANLLKKYGFQSESYIDEYRDNDQFDNYFFENEKIVFKSFYRYLSFLDIIKRFDIIITNFDGGFLRYTNLRYLEHFFLKISLKKIIVWPYGADSTIYSDMIDHSFRYGYYKSYPKSAKNEETLKKKIKYFCKHADFIIGNIPHHESLPRWDILTVACYGVDTDLWSPKKHFKSNANGKDEAVKILHPTNHRNVKGTNFLINACDMLKKEGIKIDLIIAENMPYEEIRHHVRNCDILAAQFLYGYALAEIEGMSCEKPVISNLENKNYYEPAKNFTYFAECPIVSSNPKNLKNQLKILIESPELRKQIGKKGRSYAKKYHSSEGQGLLWSKIINFINGEIEEGLDDWWKERA